MGPRLGDNAIKGVLVVLILVLILYMFASFQGLETQSIINAKGTNTVLAGSEQTYSLNLKTVDPLQYKTPLHYREQYGSWRLETPNGTILSPGKLSTLKAGQYNSDVTIKIPSGYPKIFLVAEIKEYQFSAANPEGPWLKDAGSIRVKEKLEIDVQTCATHADCAADLCLGEFGYCNAGFCEAKGTCNKCTSSTECSTFEEAKGGVRYGCSDSQCFVVKEETFFDQVKKSFNEPITQPGTVKQGEAPQPKQTPPALGFLILILMGGIFYMISKINSRRRR